MHLLWFSTFSQIISYCQNHNIELLVLGLYMLRYMYGLRNILGIMETTKSKQPAESKSSFSIITCPDTIAATVTITDILEQ